ncbi:hypothetical protein [Amorphus orientalis]|uniref:Uncharacterized protein n=1 Tax=Amorphus orientalis TaxID=649198 RepID=A0AAE4AUS3_9HYPH|nr:hypothetical protein [Amorphus orientalis]MDQ0317758.1 hypothetical protein [Amorphus orientalis]
MTDTIEDVTTTETSGPPRYSVQWADIDVGDEKTLGDLKTVEECDDALARLTQAIITIEGQIELSVNGVEDRSIAWRAKARKALQWKKHARKSVEQLRAELRFERKVAAINNRDHLILEEFRALLPEDQFLKVLRSAAAKNPTAFEVRR